MRRVLVVGAGFFGGLVARRLREVGVTPLVASHRGVDLRIDAEDDVSVASVLREGDIVVDTAGPFAARTTRLLRAAIERGCDVIDLSESLAWAEAVLALDARARERDVRIYAACSAIAAVTGACVRASGIDAPTSVDQFLAPASVETASPATVRAFTASLGRPMRTLRDGALVVVRGYTETRAFPEGRRRGGLVENAGAALLPRSWPTLRRAEFWVDPNAPFARTMLSAAARVPALAAFGRALATRLPAGALGRHDGVFAVTVRDATRERSYVLSSPRASYLIAVEPAVIAAALLARGGGADPGAVLPHAQLDPDLLFDRLRTVGIGVARPEP